MGLIDLLTSKGAMSAKTWTATSTRRSPLAPDPVMAVPRVSGHWCQLPTIAQADAHDVVGEPNRQDDIERIAGGESDDGPRFRHHTAQLITEPSNPHDPTAVRVEIGGVLVGYIPRDETCRFLPLIADLQRQGRPATCAVDIVGGWDNGYGNEGHFGVVLYAGQHPRASDPLNDPLIRSSRQVAVTGTQHHQRHLQQLLASQHAGATLLGLLGFEGDTIVVDCRGVRIGELSPAMSERYRVTVTEVLANGLEPTCVVAVEQRARTIEAHVYV
jgi:hypothetical protein